METSSPPIAVVNLLRRPCWRLSATVLVILDRLAAFDTIDHQMLLSRFEYAFRITGDALSWVLSETHNTLWVSRIIISYWALPGGVDWRRSLQTCTTRLRPRTKEIFDVHQAPRNNHPTARTATPFICGRYTALYHSNPEITMHNQTQSLALNDVWLILNNGCMIIC